MVTTEDCDCVSKLLLNTISMLCQNSIKFNKELRIEGILGITVDRDVIFLVRVNETFSKSSHDSNVRVPSSVTSTNSPRPCRPPAARRLALMPPQMISTAESNSPRLQSNSSVLAWALESSTSPNVQQVSVKTPAVQTQPTCRQVFVRGRGAPRLMRGRHMAVMGPRFPTGRPRLNIPGSRNAISLRGTKPAIRASRQPMPAGYRLPGTVTPHKMLSIELLPTAQQTCGQIIRTVLSPRTPQGQPIRKLLAIQQSPRNASPSKSASKGLGIQGQMSGQRSSRVQGPQGQFIQHSPRGQRPQGQLSIQQPTRVQGPQGQNVQQSPRGQRPQGQLSIQQSPRVQGPQGQIVQQSPRGQGPQTQLSIQSSPRVQGTQSQIIQPSPRGHGPQGQLIIQQSPRTQGPQGQIIQQFPTGKEPQIQKNIQLSSREQGAQGQSNIQQSPRVQRPPGQIVQQSPRGQGPQARLSIQQSPMVKESQGQIIQQSLSGHRPPNKMEMVIQQSPRVQRPEGQIIKESQKVQGLQGQLSIQQSLREQAPQCQMQMTIQQSPRGQGPLGKTSIQQSLREQGPQSEIIQKSLTGPGPPDQMQMIIQQALRGLGPQCQMSTQQSSRGQVPQGLIQQSLIGQIPQAQMSIQQSPRGIQTLNQKEHRPMSLVGLSSGIRPSMNCTTNHVLSMEQASSTEPYRQTFHPEAVPRGRQGQPMRKLFAIQHSAAGEEHQQSAIQMLSSGQRPAVQMTQHQLSIQTSPGAQGLKVQMANHCQRSTSQQLPREQGAQPWLTVQQSPIGQRPHVPNAQQQSHIGQQQAGQICLQALYAPVSPSVQMSDVSLVKLSQSSGQQLITTNIVGQTPAVNQQCLRVQLTQNSSPSVLHPAIPGMSRSSMSVASYLAAACSSSPIVYAEPTSMHETSVGLPSNVYQDIGKGHHLSLPVASTQSWLPVQFVKEQHFQQQQHPQKSQVPLLIQTTPSKEPQQLNTLHGQLPPSPFQFQGRQPNLQTRSQPVQIRPQCPQTQLRESNQQPHQVQSSEPIVDSNSHSEWLNQFIDAQLNRMPSLREDEQLKMSSEVTNFMPQQNMQQVSFEQLLCSRKSPVLSHMMSDKQNVLSTTCAILPRSCTSTISLSGSGTSLSSSLTLSPTKVTADAKFLRSSISAISPSVAPCTRSSSAVTGSQPRTATNSRKVAEVKSAAVVKESADLSTGACTPVASSGPLPSCQQDVLLHHSLQSTRGLIESDENSQSSNATIVSTSWCGQGMLSNNTFRKNTISKNIYAYILRQR